MKFVRGVLQVPNGDTMLWLSFEDEYNDVAFLRFMYWISYCFAIQSTEL